MNPDYDDLAKKAEREFKKMKKKRPKETKPEVEKHTTTTGTTTYAKMQALLNSMASTKSSSSVYTAGANTLSYASFSGFDTLPVVKKPQDPHTDKGVCQESYDQGYEDGLKAAKEGDTRIK